MTGFDAFLSSFLEKDDKNASKLVLEFKTWAALRIILKTLANERKKYILSGPFYGAESFEHEMISVDVT